MENESTIDEFEQPILDFSIVPEEVEIPMTKEEAEDTLDLTNVIEEVKDKIGEENKDE